MDRNGVVTSSRANKGSAEFDAAVELMRRCRHASASVGVRIYVYGGLRGGKDSATLELVLLQFILEFQVYGYTLQHGAG